MATYKVLQDIEAEDKFLGPLTLKQFIFGAIAIVSSYVSFLLITKKIWVMVIPLVPVILVTGFLAFPWGRDQPTETWLLAKIRFMFKPRKRIWDQSGIQELVKITAPPPTMEYTGDDLSQTEVRSRLKALAETIDSRGWIVKNVSADEYTHPAYGSLSGSSGSDRLVAPSSLPSVNSNINDNQIVDMFDNSKTSQLAAQIAQSDQQHRQETVDRFNQMAGKAPTMPMPDLWFMNEPPQPDKDGMTKFGTSSVPNNQPSYTLPDTFRKENVSPVSQDEKILSESLKAKRGKPYDGFHNHKTILPASQQKTQKPQAVPVTPRPDPVTIGLARNNDRSIDSLARETNKVHQQIDDDEVIVSLH